MCGQYGSSALGKAVSLLRCFFTCLAAVQSGLSVKAAGWERRERSLCESRIEKPTVVSWHNLVRPSLYSSSLILFIRIFFTYFKNFQLIPELFFIPPQD